MIPAHKKRQVRCGSFAAVIFVEVANRAIFGGHGHGIQVVGVADCLMISESFDLELGAD